MDSKAAIDNLVAEFFGLFSNLGGGAPDLGRAYSLFVDGGVIARCVPSEPEIFTVDRFIAPRQELLSNGTLTEFSEVETSATTEVVGHIAQRRSTYRKSGVLDGVPFVTDGVKIFQLVDTPAGWRILSVAWDDERNGFRLPSTG